jgi:ATP-binding cassette subfamily B protein
MKHLKYLNKYLIKYKWKILAGALFVLLSNIFRVWQPKVIRDAMDLVLGTVERYRENGIDTFSSELGSTLFNFGMIVLLLSLIMGVFMYFMRQTIIVVSRLIEYDLRKEIFNHYTNLDQVFLKTNKTGDLMSRITEDVSKVRMYLGPGILYFFNLITLFSLVIWSMFDVSTKLTLFTLLPLPILSVSIFYVSRLIHRKSEKIQIQLALLNSLAQEIYSGIRVVKSFVQEKALSRFFGTESQNYMEKSMSLAKVNALFFPLMLLLVSTSTIVTIYVGGLLVIAGEITAGNILEFVIYVNMLTWPVTAIGWIASIVQRAAASQKRINEFLSYEPAITKEGDAIERINGEVEFRNVTFTYPESGITALKNLSFKLKKGEKLAIIGRTASGKSTIAELLLRMYDPEQGEILIDGKNIREMDIAGLRKNLGYVPQDVFLFSDSVEHNILFGKEKSIPGDVERYAEFASVKEDINSLPEKFNTKIGERGVRLSGGQKQRISLARALIKEPSIVILDDCLSSVDMTTEQKIISHLMHVLNEKTALVITHRVHAMLDFDQIIVLEYGQIQERGNHEELIALNGIYSELYHTQQQTEKTSTIEIIQ